LDILLVGESYSAVCLGSGLDLAGVNRSGLNSTDVLGILGETNHCCGLSKGVLRDII
jgi:hypothetical protein